MNRNRLITLAVAAVYTLMLVVWHLYDPSKGFTEHVPGADERPKGTERKADDVLIGEFFMEYDHTAPVALSGKWNGFRGPNHDNIAHADVQMRPLQGDLPVLWSVETGEGHAAAAISDGRVFVLDYNEQLSSDALRCINLQTGEELWRRWYRVPMKRNHGFSRTIPAIADNRVISVGPEGHVMCCDVKTGDLLWTLDMKKRYGSEIPFWYTGQCPCVVEDEVILAPAGKDTLMIGVDLQSGEVRWGTPNTIGFKMSHSSVIPMTLNGVNTLTYVGVGGVCGISAEKSDRGRLLWSANKWQPSVVAPSPLQLGSNLIYLVAGYGAGGALVQIGKNGNGWKADVIDQFKADKGMSSEQQTPILYKDMLFTILPKDGGAMRERLAIYSPTDLHKPVWTSASDERFGLGPYVVIDDKLYILRETGDLYIYQIQKNSMALLHKQTVIKDGVDAWGPMAYADGYLVVRDAKYVVCIQLGESTGKKTD